MELKDISSLSDDKQQEINNKILDNIRVISSAFIDWKNFITSSTEITQDLIEKHLHDNEPSSYIQYFLKKMDVSATTDEVIEYINTKLKSHIYDLLKIIKEEVSKKLNNNNKYSLDDIASIEDKIGDSFNIRDIIDIGNRDNCFIYINGDIIIGKSKSDIHQDLVVRYMLDKDIQPGDNFNPRMRTVDDLGGAFDASTPIAFGHIYDNIAYIETCENCTIEEVKNALNGRFNKIYAYDRFDNGGVIQRVAKQKYDINEHDDLINYNDQPGDIIKCPSYWYPEHEFEYLFIFANGQLFTNKDTNCGTHYQLIEHSFDNINKIDEPTLTCGYIWDDIAFIDAFRYHVNPQVITALKELCNKVYLFNADKHQLKRLAKVVKL